MSDKNIAFLLAKAFVGAGWDEKPTCKEAAELIQVSSVNASDRDEAWNAYLNLPTAESSDDTDASELPTRPELETNSESVSVAEPNDDEEIQSDPEVEEVEGFYIKTIRGLKRFRRAGFSFNEAGHGIQKSLLTDEQIKVLKNESKLIVEECTFPINGPAVETE